MFRTLWKDAVELTRACGASGDVKPSLARTVLSTDSYAITTLMRLRTGAAELHIPLVNHALRLVQTGFYGIEIGKYVTLGNGVYFVHPLGIVIGGDAVIGDRVRFYGSNTVGTAKDNGYPVLEEDVWVGAGARILGPVRIGARAKIGANAVVLHDVAADSVVVGIPARPVRKRP